MHDDDSIELSPEHGLNPTMGVCFRCGKPTGEIALLGRVRTDGCDDAEAPREAVLSLDPCAECVKEMKENGQVCLVKMGEHGPERHVTIGVEGGDVVADMREGHGPFRLDEEQVDAIDGRRVALVEADAFDAVCATFAADGE